MSIMCLPHRCNRVPGKYVMELIIFTSSLKFQYSYFEARLCWSDGGVLNEPRQQYIDIMFIVI